MEPRGTASQLVREQTGQRHFSGHKDTQVKHMGCHIELEEIEHALDLLPDVAQVAVVYHRANAAYGKLIGSVASAADLGEKALQTGFAQRLSDYMISGRILVREHLPKKANSKVDRQRLKAQISENST